MKKESESDSESSESEKAKVFNIFRPKNIEPQTAVKRHRAPENQIFKDADEILRATERSPKKGKRKPYYQGQLYDNIPAIDEQANVKYNIVAPDRRPLIVNGPAVKRRPLPTIAPNYTFWGDLIFKPGSRSSGMVLFVEGTSRWCWCKRFGFKDAETIRRILSDFIHKLQGRITSLVTDAGTEWSKVPVEAAKWGFTWFRKNVAVVGHGGMARLDRTVRTLRYYMQYLYIMTGTENWYELFNSAVKIFNNEHHKFGRMTPDELIRNPKEMHWVRMKDYQSWPNYADIMGYVKKKGRKYYAEVDPDDPSLRYRYRTFMKGRDRHVFNRKPRQIKYIVGNKFILDDDPFSSDYMYDARQLLPVEDEKYVTATADEYEMAHKIGRLNNGDKFAKKEKGPSAKSGDERFDMGII